MRFASYLSTLALLASTACADVQGFDISHYQTTVDFEAAYAGGLRFVYIKATEGTTYQDPKFSSHYSGATSAGFIRGAYHFAQPGSSSGAAQANYFVAHGGGWTSDGITLPGMLDLEVSDCGGLSTTQTVAWIKSFSDQYHSLTGRYPVIYTNLSWWTTCTGNSDAFKDDSPLMLARWASAPGTIPGGWPYQTIWQYKDSNEFGGDSDVFNGGEAGLKKLATA
ncbi:uncharacterized protein N0V89_007501 [Didymosphaeria variabile]|uniref:N,O-diacetylmuramidase n=1 Tax=Didymosphaeria variabile TaxID=1932322 RepID=A0A9W8XJI6_9PLEO|nr:uncharacterized protein N0V89_007501 [Didymosphaeria variabile]KAJ4352154.1 hypothetical protein N0V89_007501 [Didymosphaeria variabile]